MISTVYPASFSAPPQVQDSQGPVLASPVLVPVFFGNESSASIQEELTAFAAGLGATTYWSATTSEYGIGAAGSATPVILSESAPTNTDDATIQSWLSAELANPDAGWPAPTANTLYLLNYPSGTTVTLTQGTTFTSCSDFAGYHSAITFNGLKVAYAVFTRCASYGELTGLNALTAAQSEQIINSVTDPYQLVAPAFAQPDANHFYWSSVLGGGEVGNLCSQNPNVFTEFAGFPYTVQRSWSNAAALAGHDPCEPELPGEVYFNSVPELSDAVPYMGNTMLGVDIAVGSSQTIPLDLYSEGDTGGPWSVAVYDYAELQGSAANLTFVLDQSTGQNGQKLNLTITSVAAGPNGLSPFLVISTLGQASTLWLGLVYSG